MTGHSCPIRHEHHLAQLNPGRMLTAKAKPLRNVRHVDHMMVSPLVLIHRGAKGEKNYFPAQENKEMDPSGIISICLDLTPPSEGQRKELNFKGEQLSGIFEPLFFHEYKECKFRGLLPCSQPLCAPTSPLSLIISGCLYFPHVCLSVILKGFG